MRKSDTEETVVSEIETYFTAHVSLIYVWIIISTDLPHYKFSHIKRLHFNLDKNRCVYVTCVWHEHSFPFRWRRRCRWRRPRRCISEWTSHFICTCIDTRYVNCTHTQTLSFSLHLGLLALSFLHLPQKAAVYRFVVVVVSRRLIDKKISTKFAVSVFPLRVHCRFRQLKRPSFQYNDDHRRLFIQRIPTKIRQLSGTFKYPFRFFLPHLKTSVISDQLFRIDIRRRKSVEYCRLLSSFLGPQRGVNNDI